MFSASLVYVVDRLNVTSMIWQPLKSNLLRAARLAALLAACRLAGSTKLADFRLL